MSSEEYDINQFADEDDYDELGVWNPKDEQGMRDPIRYFRYSDSKHRILFQQMHDFITKLKIEIALDGKDLPLDVHEEILEATKKKDKSHLYYTDHKLRLIDEYDAFIKTELRNRLKKLGITFNQSDMFVNVVNYAKSKKLDLSNSSIINNKILPWLGKEGFIYSAELFERFNQTIKKLNGGSKLFKRKSRYNSRKIQKRQIISKKIKKI